MKRRWYYMPPELIGTSDKPGDERGVRVEVATEEEATLIGSLVQGEEDTHLPVIDIDLPCVLLETSTPGHYHLYIEKEMSWADYLGILRALAAAGVIEEGYLYSSEARGQTFVRKPGVTK